MCGIAGFIDVQSSRDNAERLIDSMCKVIRHRGPDDQGAWVGDGAALGMRRLSIIDLAGGHQPIFNEDESILIVFNGEIYNYHELRQDLQKRGHSFGSNSDTEVIVHAYEEYGDDCVKCLRGMFTFALWDRRRQRLLAARDRFGKKPLNYFWDGQRLIFGSEVKSILEAGIPREVNAVALDEYLVYGYVPTPNTLFKGVLKLPAAHILSYEDGQISTKRYWELPFTPTCQDDEVTAIGRTRAMLKDAVQVRLMSEVPLGAFLSGGIDSSLVVGLMSQMMSQPVKTFSIGFEEEDYSELPYARKVAKHFGTAHHEFYVRPDLVSVLPELVWACDEPFADPSLLPTYYVSKLAREHVTVVLSGDGGDEIFGGYDRYERELANKRALTLLPVTSRASMYHSDYFSQVCSHYPYERLMSEFHAARHLDSMAQMQFVDVRSYLTSDILVKVDKASMLNSLETRAPMLDQHLVEYVSSLPSTIRTHDGVLKYLLKKVAADMLPAVILTRPKQGFGIPIQYWFRRDLLDYIHEVLDSPRARQRGIFNTQFIRNLLKAHTSRKLANYSEAIWALLCLEHWFQVYMDDPSIHVEPHAQVEIISSR